LISHIKDDEQGCNKGVNISTGVAENDKENISQRRRYYGEPKKEVVPSKQLNNLLPPKMTTKTKYWRLEKSS
jgi:hypothetical protein